MASDDLTQVVYRLPALVSGGLMLSYRCTNACRHCLYRSSPDQADQWLSPVMAQRIATALMEETGLVSLHVGGGEPCMRFDLLSTAVWQLVNKGLPLAYVETNAFWCVNEELTRRGLQILRQVGLPGLLVSASPFHNEFVPFHRTRICVKVARELFGSANVIVYEPQGYQLLSDLPEDEVHSFEYLAECAQVSPRELLMRYDVVMHGRAVQAFKRWFPLYPPIHFKGHTCQTELLDTAHFHIDPEGLLFTGGCAGLVVATITELHPEIRFARNPILARLLVQGPYGLMLYAQREFGFEPHPEGYMNKCDLCFDVRRRLALVGQFDELRPAAFYA